MSELANDAKVILLLADYSAIDASGKINALGAAFLVTGLSRDGMTPPQHLVVIIDLPGRHSGEQFPLMLELRQEATGQPVAMIGPSGQAEPLRIQQMVVGQRPVIPGVFVPDSVPVRIQVGMGFPTGFQLPGPGAYTWRVELDGQHRAGWEATFHVLGPMPGPVFGGPVGPADVNLPPGAR